MNSKKGIARPQSQLTHSCVCERFIYSQDRSTYFLQQNRQSDRSQKHEYRNWDWVRAVSFPGIFVSNFWYCVFLVRALQLPVFLKLQNSAIEFFLSHCIYFTVCMCILANVAKSIGKSALGRPYFFYFHRIKLHLVLCFKKHTKSTMRALNNREFGSHMTVYWCCRKHWEICDNLRSIYSILMAAT